MSEYTVNPTTSQLSDTMQYQTFVEEKLNRHEGLVQAVIRREGSGTLTYEEALQAGRIGLWRAILGYEPKRDTAFSTYAWVAIRRHIRRAATKATSDTECCGLLPAQAPNLSSLTANHLPKYNPFYKVSSSRRVSMYGKGRVFHQTLDTRIFLWK